MNLLVKDIIKTTNGKLIIGNENIECKNFCIDTRKIQENDVYVGIKGEKFDGNTLWKEALENGASVDIIANIDFSNENLEKFKNKAIILVDDTKKALQQIAKKKREMYGKDFPIIAITGSVGKTSTKDMVANVLNQKYKTLKTEGNFNNDVGLPLTLLRLENHEAAVVEMGMNHFGEIRLLTNIANPTISVITNIGTSHIGNLGSRENILKAKLEILEGMDKPTLVLNEDNDLLQKWREENSENIITYTYGIENNALAQAKDIKLNEENSEFTCILGENKFNVKVPVAGIHFVYNALCSAVIGNLLGLTIDEIKRGIETFELTKKRMEIINLKDGITVINDAYNASLESMRASIQNLAGYTRKKIAILGDMFELGEFSENLHREVGKEIVKNNIDTLICSGENAKFIVEEAKKQGMNKENIHYFENKEEILNFLNSLHLSNTVILWKASNGMKFFELVEKYIKQ